MKLEYIKDVTGNNFLGINIYRDAIYSYLDKMKDILGDEYDEYIKYQQDRDNGHYHCTVMNVIDLNSITLKNLDNVQVINDTVQNLDITDFKMIGLGSVEHKGNTAYFVVCRSEQLKHFRAKFKKDPIDFHITLGFKYKDVFNLRKNEVLPDVDPFKILLKKYFMDFEQSFDFLKEMDDYDFAFGKDIYCTKIADSYAEFRVANDSGSHDYFTVTIINNGFRISCKWQGTDDLPYLSNTLILRKLK